MFDEALKSAVLKFIEDKDDNGTTFEEILERMLYNLDLDIAKNEGSILNSLSRVYAFETAEIYMYMQEILNLVFLSDTYGKYLDKRAMEFGIYRKNGEHAVGDVTFYGTKGTKIPSGTRITSAGLIFNVQEDYIIEDEKKGADALIVAEQIGHESNMPAGTIFKLVEDISGVDRIINNENFKFGEDIESDEDFRERFFYMQRNKGTSGNVNDYINWGLEVAGVKHVRVKPLWKGPGTVKVIITSDNNQVVSEEVLKTATEHINEKKPIGADVTVVTPTIKAITVSAVVEFTEEQNIEIFQNLLKDILNEMLLNKDEVTYTKVAREVSKMQGVNDYKDLLINGQTGNIQIGDEEVANVTSVTIQKGEVV